jgi:polyisoprenoid-binding protein YceI
MSKLKWLIGALVAAAVLVVGGTFVYIHFIEDDAPPPLSFDTTDTPADASAGTTATTVAAPTGSVDGTWNATGDSIVGYRVNEVLFGQSHVAAGRTNAVTGTMTIGGTTVSAASVSVDMTTVSSDSERRDQQFNGRIMDTSQFPTATFTLTQPIDLSTIPSDSTPVSVTATGDLMLHGVSQPVTFPLQARRNGANIEINGNIPIVFADYGVSNPSFAGTVTTEDDGILEFLVVFAKG